MKEIRAVGAKIVFSTRGRVQGFTCSKQYHKLNSWFIRREAAERKKMNTRILFQHSKVAEELAKTCVEILRLLLNSLLKFLIFTFRDKSKGV